MTTLQTLARREELAQLNPTVTHVLIALLSLAIAATIAATALYLVRRIRARRAVLAQLSLPTHSKEASMSHDSLPASSPPSQPSRPRRGHGHRRTVSVIAVPSPHDLVPTPMNGQKKTGSQIIIPRHSGPLPQIHITFPDEDRDVNEKRHSGRVVVVRVSDNGCIGLAPYVEDKEGEKVPSYDGKEFMSLELERLGGLKEKGEPMWA